MKTTLKYLCWVFSLFAVLSCQKQERPEMFNLEIAEYPIYVNNDCDFKSISFRVNKVFEGQFSIFLDTTDISNEIELLNSYSSHLMYNIDISNHPKKFTHLALQYDNKNVLKIPIQYFDAGDTVALTSFDILDQHLSEVHVLENYYWPDADISQDPNFEFDTEYEVSSIQEVEDKPIEDSIQRTISLKEVKFINQNNGEAIELPDLELTYNFPDFMGKQLDYRTKNYNTKSPYFRIMMEVKSELVKPRYLVQAKHIGHNQVRVYKDCNEYDLIKNDPIIIPWYVQIDVLELMK